jgi:hypothetical protein
MMIAICEHRCRSFKIQHPAFKIAYQQVIHCNSHSINAKINGFEFDIHKTLYRPAFHAKKEWG